MPRVYRPPQFISTARIWFRELPADLTTWSGAVPSRSPNLTLPCQLYMPRYGVGRWLHGWSDSAKDSILKSGFAELRLPIGSDIGAPWGVCSEIDWTTVPLVEVPSGTGRLYGGMMQDRKHLGFPNEYVICILSQIGPCTPSPPPPPPGFVQLPSASAVDNFSEATKRKKRALPSASALTSRVRPYAVPVQLPSASALTCVILPPADLVQLPSASALEDGGIPRRRRKQLPSGSALTCASIIATKRVDLPAGSALSATYPQFVFVNPCMTSGMPTRLKATCTATTGGVAAFLGVVVILTYDGVSAWVGPGTVGGDAGTFDFHSPGASQFDFSGTSTGHWNVSAPLMPDTFVCGPPVHGDTSALLSNIGVNTGTSTWHIQPA